VSLKEEYRGRYGDSSETVIVYHLFLKCQVLFEVESSCRLLPARSPWPALIIPVKNLPALDARSSGLIRALGWQIFFFYPLQNFV
jgi:hypothetical protein